MAFDSLAHRPAFRHRALELGGNSIRLITLQPDSNEFSPVSGHVDQYSLHRRPGYTALSYMWGPEDDKFPILLNEKVFYVRRNLLDCLRQLRRHHHEPLVLWIDALCIDQDNTPERNHIVQLMDQVYERSDRVYVWLGPEDESSDRAMRFLREVADTMATRDDSVDPFLDQFMFPSTHYNDWVSVVRLFVRDYWKRLWIIQEILLAPSLELFCGDRHVLWSQVERVVLLLQRSLKHFNKRFPERSFLFEMIVRTVAARMIRRRVNLVRQGSSRQKYPTLQTLLEEFKDSQCYEARDEIFGLLSIAGDFREQRIDYIDYDLRDTEVFVRFLKYYLQTSINLTDNDTLWNIRRLSDALRLNPYSDILVNKHISTKASISYGDLTINTGDSCFTMPGEVLLSLSDSDEDLDASKATCQLKDYFGSSGSVSALSPLSPAASTFTISLPDSPEQLTKLRRLAREHASEVCNAWTHEVHADPTEISYRPPTFKYFTRPTDNATTQSRPYFGLACSAARPGDVLVKTNESDLTFVARPSNTTTDTTTDNNPPGSEKITYDVVGTALVHKDSGTLYKLKSSVRKWWHPQHLHPHLHHSHTNQPGFFHRPGHGHGHGHSHSTSSLPIITSSAALTDPDSDSLEEVGTKCTLRFNPLMLLMIVNEPNWRKDKISDILKSPEERHTLSYTAIQPRGTDDPVLKEFGRLLSTGSPLLDRTANKIFDRNIMQKLEEFKELAHYYDDAWESD